MASPETNGVQHLPLTAAYHDLLHLISREASLSTLIGYWESYPKTPLATVCRDVWQWSRVTRVNSRAGTVFMPPAQTVCQPIMKSQLRALLLLWTAEGQETTLAHFITVGSQWYTPVCSTVYSCENFCVLPTKQTLPPFYPSGLSSRDSSLLRVLRHWVFFPKQVVPLNMAVPQHT